VILAETDLFRILGLDFDASPDDIRSAYKKLAKQAHPDMFTDAHLKTKAEKAFISISDAFNTLRDPFKRKDYERTLDRVRQAEADAAKAAAKAAESAKAAHSSTAPPASAETPKAQPSPAAAESAAKARQARQEQADLHFQNGKEYEKRNELDEAIREFQEAIRLSNDVAKYHSQLGLALQKKNWGGYAQAEFKVALHFDPTDKLALKHYQPSAGLTIPRSSLGFKLLNMFKSPGQSNRIGDILIKQGHLNKDQLQSALKKQSDEKLMLGEILIRMKYIKPEHLAQALIQQAESLAKDAAENSK